MADFVMFTLNDGAQVYFEASENDLVTRHGGAPDVHDAGRLASRLEPVATAAAQVAESLRAKLSPDEVMLEFGVKISGEVNWWFFAKNQGEATINVTLTWRQPGEPA